MEYLLSSFYRLLHKKRHCMSNTVLMSGLTSYVQIDSISKKKSSFTLQVMVVMENTTMDTSSILQPSFHSQPALDSKVDPTGGNVLRFVLLCSSWVEMGTSNKVVAECFFEQCTGLFPAEHNLKEGLILTKLTKSKTLKDLIRTLGFIAHKTVQ